MPRYRRKIVRPNVRRLALAVTATAAAVACGAVVAMAVTPQGGTRLQGKTSYKIGTGATYVRLTVAGPGRLAKFGFPACDAAGQAPVLKNLKISAAGEFSAKRNFTEVFRAARQAVGGLYDDVYEWKVSVKGKFTAPTKAQGTLTLSFREFLRSTETGEIRDLPGGAKYGYCKTGPTTWKAKQTP